MTSTSKDIVIIGGGIIGCTTAYYLTQHKSYSPSSVKVTLIEASAHGPAQGASGKAGGLVARWAYPKEIVNASFEEHVKLAEIHGGKERWGWRYVGCGSWEGRGEDIEEVAKGQAKLQKKKSLEKTLGLPGGQKPGGRETKGLPDDLEWIDEDLTDSYAPMAKSGATAQVHPYLFTSSMYELAKEDGLEYIHGRVTNILIDKGRVTGLEYSLGSDTKSQTIKATDVILCAGAWSSTLLPTLPLTATRAHSITIRPQTSNTPIAPYVLFTEISGLPATAGHSRPSPEIYARPDDEVYACGPGDDETIPATVDNVAVDESACEAIRMHVSSISSVLRGGTVEKRQACY